MTGYLTGFLVYMLAMLGIIFIALVVVKKSITFSSVKQKNSFLKIESRLNIEPRKNLYVIKAGNERFLVSSGIEGCQFMTKIGEKNIPSKTEISTDEINIKNKAHYLSIENKFISFSKEIKIPIDHLDLAFWSHETGEIFK